jgi:hypothetical protein
MHRLQQFVVGTILPEWERVVVNRELSDQSELPMMAVLVIEGFLWLHLGVELGAFPREASEDVYLFYYPPFFRWLKSYRETTQIGRDQRSFLQSAPYLGLPVFARVLVSKGIDEGQPLYDQPSGVGEIAGLIGPLQSLLILYSRLCRDTAVRRFLYGIGFQGPDDWRMQWNEQCTAEDLFNAVESTDASPTAMVLAGYIKLCEYARNTNEVMINIEGLGILDSARSFQFRDRIRNIHAWRLDLSSGHTAERFEQIREKVRRMVDQELTSLGLDGDVKRVQELLESSLERFFQLEPVFA